MQTIVICLLFGVLWTNEVFAQQQNDIETVLAQRLAVQQKTVLVNGQRVSKIGVSLNEICDLSDPVSNRIFREYGAMLVGNNNFFAEFKQVITGNQIRFLANCVLRNQAEAELYQTNVSTKTANLGGVIIQLQAAAMDALLAAVDEAARRNLRITPRGGPTAAKRSFDDTLKLWDSRFNPALNHWVRKGKISPKDAAAARKKGIWEQVAQVLEWERQGLWFSKDLTKSILYSVAAPGASQHIFMLALDVEQFANREVRTILAKHGWFQTVKSDLPHFTYLGVSEDQLPGLGLKAVFVGNQKFWIPQTKRND